MFLKIKISFESARPEKGFKNWPLRNVKTKIFILKHCPTISSEMRSMHPFYPILIPNTPYVRLSFTSHCYNGGSKSASERGKKTKFTEDCLSKAQPPP